MGQKRYLIFQLFIEMSKMKIEHVINIHMTDTERFTRNRFSSSSGKPANDVLSRDCQQVLSSF